MPVLARVLLRTWISVCARICYTQRMERDVFKAIDSEAQDQCSESQMSAGLNEELSAQVAFDWPREAMQSRDWSIAGQRWKLMRKVYPDEPAPWFQGIIAHLHADELDLADGLLDDAQSRFPNHPGCVLSRAELAIKRGHWDLASEIMDQARVSYPKSPQTWVICADLAEQRGDTDEVSACLFKACEWAPERPNLLLRYAEAAMSAGDLEEAIKRWEIVRLRFPDLDAGYVRGAQLYTQLGRLDEANRLLLAHKHGPDFAPALGEDQIRHEQAELSPCEPRVVRSGVGALLSLIWVKAVFHLRSEMRRNYLSFGWWVIEPLMYMAVYQLVFDVLLNRGGEHYSVLLMTGLIPWMWSLKAIISSSSSILAGQGLMLQVGVHPILFPSVMFVQASVRQIPVFALLVGFVWFNGFGPGMHWFALIPIIFVQFLFTAGASLFVAAVIPYIRDLSNLVPTGLTLLMFLSGIFYDYRSIDEKWHGLFMLNPVAFLIKSYREVMMEQQMPDWSGLAVRGVVCALVCGVLVMVYHRLRYVYPRVVME